MSSVDRTNDRNYNGSDRVRSYKQILPSSIFAF